MSRILFLSQLLPYPPDNGPKMRSYYVLRHLAERHEVVLLAFTRADDSPEAIRHLQEYCAEVHTVPMERSLGRNLRALAGSLVSLQSFVIRRDFVPEMAEKVRSLLGSSHFDYVHADQLWMAQYALLAPRGSNGRSAPKLVLDEHNACFQLFQRLARGERGAAKRLLWEYEWRTIRAYEARTCAKFDHLVTVTGEDEKTLGGLMAEGRSKKSVKTLPALRSIPICVDTRSVEPVCPQPDAMDVLNMGTMYFMPNIEGVLWFANQVWPMVASQVQNASFTIIGKNPPEEVRQLAEISARMLASPTPAPMPRIYVTGYVKDPRPYLEKAGAFVVPLFSGSGMRVKIIDAWRWGLPIISTSIGAEGIQYRDGENILIANDAESFARAVVRVLSDPNLAQRLRENGRRWVEEHYEWQTVYQAWDEIYPCPQGE